MIHILKSFFFCGDKWIMILLSSFLLISAKKDHSLTSTIIFKFYIQSNQSVRIDSQERSIYLSLKLSSFMNPSSFLSATLSRLVISTLGAPVPVPVPFPEHIDIASSTLLPRIVCGKRSLEKKNFGAMTVGSKVVAMLNYLRIRTRPPLSSTVLASDY